MIMNYGESVSNPCLKSWLKGFDILINSQQLV